MKRLTEEEMNESNESTDESNESIHHKKNKDDRRNKQTLQSNSKKNGVRKEFITDTGSPITIMPMDKKIVEPTEIRNVTNPYQDVNKNELKSCGNSGGYRIRK